MKTSAFVSIAAAIAFSIVGTLFFTGNLQFVNEAEAVEPSALEMGISPEIVVDCEPELIEVAPEVIEKIVEVEVTAEPTVITKTVDSEPTPTVEPTAEATPESTAVPEVTLININTATSEELQTLSGIGEKTAEKIIAARPFETIENLTDVKGIGDSKLAAIRDLITMD